MWNSWAKNNVKGIDDLYQCKVLKKIYMFQLDKNYAYS